MGMHSGWGGDRTNHDVYRKIGNRCEHRRGEINMKKLLIVFALMLTVATMATMSEAAYVGFQTLSPIFSPDSDSTPFTLPTTDDVSMSIYGSVWLAMPAGAADTFAYAVGTSQPKGIYGMGAQLPDTSGGYNLWFDYHLRTFDVDPFDTFRLVITSGDYLWAGGTEVGGFVWGGTNGLNIEYADAGPAFWGFVDVTGSDDYYLNVVLVTKLDQGYASWGRFSDVAVETVQGVPEPSTLLLLGSGLLGLVGYGRKRMKK